MKFEILTIEPIKSRLHNSTGILFRHGLERVFVGYAKDVNDVIQVQETHLIASVNMYQDAEGFSTLCPADQRTQIKATIPDLFMLCVIVYFDIENDSIILPISRVCFKYQAMYNCMILTRHLFKNSFR